MNSKTDKMKLFLKIKTLLLLIVLSNSLIAQNDIDKVLNLQTRPNDINEYCVQTVFNKLNNSSSFFQDFLHNKIGLSEDGEPDYKLKNGIGTIKTSLLSNLKLCDLLN